MSSPQETQKIPLESVTTKDEKEPLKVETIEHKAKFKFAYTPIKELYEKPEEQVFNTKHTLMGWILRVRDQQHLIFVHMYDGSHMVPFQLVVDGDKHPELQKKIQEGGHAGATIIATGTVVKSPAKGQKYDMMVSDCQIYGTISDPKTYLPGIKRPTLETIRPIQHLRAKFQAYQSVYRIRSKLMKIVHDYFDKLGFHYLDPNVITTADCEGGGEVFRLVPAGKKVEEKPVESAKENDKKKEDDILKAFFGKEAFLTVSSQLQLEALCAGMAKVFTMNPSFRAEQSKTRRHLCCFTHLEWEIAFIDLKDLMDFSEDLVSTIFKKVLTECEDDLTFLDKFVPESKGILDKLRSFVQGDFARVSYDEAIEIIHRDKKKILKKFKSELKEIPKWGDDLGSYCERYLCEDIYKRPTFVHSFPLDLKSFYMKALPAEEVKLFDGTSVTRRKCMACDLLIPGTGELIGSSIREDKYDVLMKEVERRKMDITPIQWYVDLRKDGTFPHGGAGLGFDRLVSICCFMEGNIRDGVPFPVAFGECFY